MSRYHSICYALGTAICLLAGCGQNSGGGFSEPFLRAVDADDRPAAMHRLIFYQNTLHSIQMGNPKALWPKLTEELDARGVDYFWEQSPGGRYKDTRKFFAPKHKRELTETKPDGAEGRVDEYVTVTYATPFPVIDIGGHEVPLKQCIFKLVWEERTGLIVTAERVKAGDVSPAAGEPVQPSPADERTK